jgi:hypothetical protein
MDKDSLEELMIKDTKEVSYWRLMSIIQEIYCPAYFARRVHRLALSIAAGKTARDTSGHPGEEKSSEKTTGHHKDTVSHKCDQ